jgi:hypothetical protein
MRDLRQAVHGRAIIMEKRVYKHQILKKLIKKKKNMIWMFVQLYLQIAIGGA